MIKIPLSKGYEAIIDDIDSDLIAISWHIVDEKNLYASHTNRNNTKGNVTYSHTRMHRVILERIIGRPLEKHELTDHINLNPLDNRRCNLRVATKEQNMQNKRKQTKSLLTLKGVFDRRKYNKIHKYTTSITHNKKYYYIGKFKTEVEAAFAYDCMALILHKEFAQTNFIKR